MGFYGEFLKGIWRENPTFRIVLGICPTLAISTSVINGVGMGLAATFVLLGSNVFISLIRNMIPDKIRIPAFIVVISTFVTIVDLAMAAFTPELHKALGIFIPLIVVNCIILGRAEAFACKATVWMSVADALGMGAGFTLALSLISAIRELLGSGTLLGFHLMPSAYVPAVIMILPPGAFLTIGPLLGFFNYLSKKRAK